MEATFCITEGRIAYFLFLNTILFFPESVLCVPNLYFIK